MNELIGRVVVEGLQWPGVEGISLRASDLVDSGIIVRVYVIRGGKPMVYVEMALSDGVVSEGKADRWFEILKAKVEIA